MQFENSIQFAKNSDNQDPLRKYRDAFLFPTFHDKPIRYFTGNSLGLQPKSMQTALQSELNNWAKWGVEGHFKSENPWFSYHEALGTKVAKIVGAQPNEVVVMNSLTVNLHLLMVSFFQPKGKRTKLLFEAKAFPSDWYTFESQVKFHGLDPEVDLVPMHPRDGEHLLRDEDIIAKINELGDTLCLVLFGGINYYTGQVFDMKNITAAGHAVGAMVGFDLAHAAGNIPMELHNWDVDFATWCSYKYMNSSPGGVSGIFVNERFSKDTHLPRFAGWWGAEKETRFLMAPNFQPMEGAEGWQLSNAPILLLAAHHESLKMFDEVGMSNLRKKSLQLTGYLEFILDELSSKYADKCRFEIITPRDPEKRGAQLSILLHGKGKELFEAMAAEGVVTDWREPNVIRIAPAPFYNSFEDVYELGQIIESILR